MEKADAELWQLGKLGGQVDVVEGEDEDQDEDAVVCREWRYIFLKKITMQQQEKKQDDDEMRSADPSEDFLRDKVDAAVLRP